MKYLTPEQTEKLGQFLSLRNISRVHIANILGLSNGSVITYYLKNNRFRRTDFEKVKKVLTKEALSGFELIDF